MSRPDRQPYADSAKPRAGPPPRVGRRRDPRRALPLALGGLLVALAMFALASLRWSASAELVLHGGLLSVLLLVFALGERRRSSSFDGVVARLGAAVLFVGALLAVVRVSGLEFGPHAVPLEVTAKTLGVVLVGFTFGRRAFAGERASDGATLRSTFDSVSDPIVVIDVGCRIVEVNWFAELRFEEPLTGRLACETSYFSRESCEGCPVAACFDGGSARFFTVRDGDRRPRYEVASIPVPHEGGAISGVVQHVTDVSARSIGEERVRFLGEVVAAVDHGVVGLGPRGNISAVNPSACRLLGVEENAAIGRTLPELLPVDDGSRRWVADRVAAASPSRLDLTLRGAADGDRQVVFTIDPIHDDFGGRIGAAVLLRDVTERRASEARLRQSERLSALGTFVSGLAHELNSPIAAVCGAIDRLESGDEDEASTLTEIRGQADRCRRVIAGLLRFARRTVASRRDADLGRIVEAVASLLGRAIARDGITLKVSDPGGVVASVDEHLIEQVVLNLVTNARDAIRSSSRRGRIDLRIAIEGDDAVIEVADDGPGLPEGDPELLFQPFETTKAEGAGTGLGLSLARGFVHDHDGTLTACRRSPRGASFTLRLPRAGIERSPTEPPESTDSADVGAVAAGSGRKVLVIEDEPGIAEYLRFCLESGGYVVSVTTCITDARVLLLGTGRDGEWEQVVSDVSLEDGRGPDLYREVAERKPALRGRFVFVTADSFSDSEPLTADGNRVVFKPFGRDELISAMESPTLST